MVGAGDLVVVAQLRRHAVLRDRLQAEFGPLPDEAVFVQPLETVHEVVVIVGRTDNLSQLASAVVAWKVTRSFQSHKG